MNVKIELSTTFKGIKRGNGTADARVIFIDRSGKEHIRCVNAAGDTRNTTELKALTQALRILIKPCEVEVVTGNDYIKNTVKNGWVENWKENDWKRKNGKEPTNVEVWKELYLSMQLHKVRFSKEEE